MGGGKRGICGREREGICGRREERDLWEEGREGFM